MYFSINVLGLGYYSYLGILKPCMRLLCHKRLILSLYNMLKRLRFAHVGFKFFSVSWNKLFFPYKESNMTLPEKQSLHCPAGKHPTCPGICCHYQFISLLKGFSNGRKGCLWKLALMLCKTNPPTQTVYSPPYFIVSRATEKNSGGWPLEWGSLCLDWKGKILINWSPFGFY